MTFYRKKPLSFLFYLSLFIFCLIKFDHFFFKKNESFCCRNIYAHLPHRSEWEISSDLLPPADAMSSIFKQKFIYLNKGHQSYVFISEDQKYVIKFYRFPSHLRPLPWLNRPFAYHFNAKRKEIKKYNLEKLELTFRSFKIAFEELKDQSGLVYLHLNKTDHLKRKLKIIDKLNMEYEVDLDAVPFAVQRCAQLLYPTLEALIEKNEIATAKKIISSLVEVLCLTRQKGIINEDPILEKNYGIVDNSVIHIDIGRFVNACESSSLCRKETLKTTKSLQDWLNDHHEDLYHFAEDLIYHAN